MQQHFIDISMDITMITELESTKGENYPNVDTLLLTLGNNLPWCGRVEKLLHCPARKENFNHMTKREIDILTHTQVPDSVWENFNSCLSRKLSRQEKHLFNVILIVAWLYLWKLNERCFALICCHLDSTGKTKIQPAFKFLFFSL